MGAETAGAISIGSSLVGAGSSLLGGSNSSDAAESTQADTGYNTSQDRMALMTGFQNAYNDFQANSGNALKAIANGQNTMTMYGQQAQDALSGLTGNYTNAYNQGSAAINSGISGWGNALSQGTGYINSGLGALAQGKTDATSAINAGLSGWDTAYNQGASALNSGLTEWDNKYNQVRADEANYMALGEQGLAGYSGLLTNPSSITSDPGYQFGLSQGTQALDRSAASKGLVLSGAQQKAVDQYGQDYASTKLDDILGRYKTAIDVGQTATSQVNSAGMQTAAGKGSLYNSLANLGTTTAAGKGSLYSTQAGVDTTTAANQSSAYNALANLGANTASGQGSLYNSLASLGMTSAAGQSSVGQAQANALLNTGSTISGLSATEADQYNTLSKLINSLWGNTSNNLISLDSGQNQTIASTNSAAASGENNALSGVANSLNNGVKNYLTASGYGGGSYQYPVG